MESSGNEGRLYSQKKLRNSQTRKKGYASPLYGLFPKSGATVDVGYLANYEKT